MYSNLNQPRLIDIIKSTLTETLKSHFTEKPDLLTTFMTQLDLNDLLLMNAQRKSYGNAPKQFDLYTDETDAALWTWELAQPSLYLDSAYLKSVTNLRSSLN